MHILQSKSSEVCLFFYNEKDAIEKHDCTIQ